ncbi:hypothetical protein K457DRAFT_122492 [Linnemannia elongata AG-77]|uniref:Uncharacterized protein n=1 Tax=Linnemannia elongata AG-77 TaxID=1314771 RepID=A0A197KA49_9FUNG|nr:hypothetical protein K457DRAFT_122492 [Linnemannia elongata AG-77]
MSSALDMSLEDIIKTSKASEPRNNNRTSRGGPRGARSSGPTRNGRQGRDARPYQAGVQQYRAAPVAPLHTSVIRQSIPDGSKMQVSNLDHRVSAEDLKALSPPPPISSSQVPAVMPSERTRSPPYELFVIE